LKSEKLRGICNTEIESHQRDEKLRGVCGPKIESETLRGIFCIKIESHLLRIELRGAFRACKNDPEPLLRTPIVPACLLLESLKFRKVVADDGGSLFPLLSCDQDDDPLKNTSILTKTKFRAFSLDNSLQFRQNQLESAFASLAEKFG
jgi:hypothetical protein